MIGIRLFFSFVLLLLISVSAKAQLPEPRYPVNIKSIGVADYNWSLQDLQGRNVDLKQHKGKVLVINIWATWCPPCVVEMPSFVKLLNALKVDVERGEVSFLFISDENSNTVSRFIKGHGYALPIAITRSTNTPDIFLSRGIPITYIVSPDGEVVYKHLGTADWSTEKTIQFIRGLRR